LASENSKRETALRKAAALILASRYKARGAPVSRVLNILKQSGMPINQALDELEERLNAVGIKLKRITFTAGTKKMEKFVAIVDPQLKLEELKPFDNVTLAVLALIYIKISTMGEVSLSSLLNDLISILMDKERAEKFLQTALSKLEANKIIKIDTERGLINLTDLGYALMPPPELIDRIIIDALADLAKGGEK